MLLGTVVFCGLAADGEDMDIPARILQVADTVGVTVDDTHRLRVEDVSTEPGRVVAGDRERRRLAFEDYK